jgi:RimJ/RimL family protein N-acetyltransferase
MDPVVLTTERLTLRPFTLADAPDVQRLAGEHAVADTTLHVPHPYLDGMAERWIATHAPNRANGSGVVFAITASSDAALVGAISLDAIAGHGASLGYWIALPYWGRGYCTEAGHAVLRYAFETLDLHRVHAIHLCRNPASGRVMQKLGMRHEGGDRMVRKDGVHEEIERYTITSTR